MKNFLGSQSPQINGVVLGIMAALIWGTWPVLSRLGLRQSLDSFDIIALRFGIAGLILLPVVWRRGFRGVPLTAITVLTFGAGIPYLAIMMTGLNYAPAAHGGIITPSCMLTFTALGSWIFMKERPGISRLVGLGIIITGVATIGWAGFVSGDENTWIGDLLFAAGGILWGSFTLANRYWAVEPLQATAIVSVLSMIGFLPFYFLLSDHTFISAPVDEVIFQGLVQGVFSGLLALLFYTRAVALLGAAKGSIFGALVPVTALLLAIPVLGEIPGPAELVGLSMVSLGMIAALGYLKIYRRRLKAPA